MILLTGATGYLGSQIARELIARGEPFRVFVREPSRLDFNRAQVNCEVEVGEMEYPPSLERAVAGIDTVIHTAALVKSWVRDRRDFWRINVEGLKSLLQAAARAGVKKVIYTSSFLALGPSADAKAGEELENPGPHRNDYEATKAQALAWLRREGFQKYPVVALYPGVIYGPGPITDGNLVGGMIAQYLAGKFPGVLGSGWQRWSFAYNADVAAAHLVACEKGKPGDEYVLGGDNRTLNEFFHVLSEVSGVKRHIRHMPYWSGKFLGAVEIARARLTGHTPQLTPGVVEILKHDWVYSSAKAARDLGYHVRPLEEGLKLTLKKLSH